MERLKQQHITEEIFQIHKNIARGVKLVTVRHFVGQGKDKSYTYKLLRKFRERGSAKIIPHTGRPKRVSSEKVSEKVCRHFTKNPSS